jgi:SAM-dependent methyltransferase
LPRSQEGLLLFKPGNFAAPDLDHMQVLNSKADRLLRKVSPSYRLKRKQDAELAYWQGELSRLDKWFRQGTVDWWGLKPPAPEQKLFVSDLWVVNAVATRNALRPTYLERLKVERDFFKNKRVLEVGCGPMAPILQFDDCERHGVDPLLNVYMAAGWPLFAYDARFVNTGAELLPYPDGYFDAVMSVNALDHVDDFEQVASEMTRVLKPGGGVYFEVEYHTPTVTEPLRLSDNRVRNAFPGCELQLVASRSGHEVFEALVRRFNLMPFEFQHFEAERFCTWHGVRR